MLSTENITDNINQVSNELKDECHNQINQKYLIIKKK